VPVHTHTKNLDLPSHRVCSGTTASLDGIERPNRVVAKQQAPGEFLREIDRRFSYCLQHILMVESFPAEQQCLSLDRTNLSWNKGRRRRRRRYCWLVQWFLETVTHVPDDRVWGAIGSNEIRGQWLWSTTAIVAYKRTRGGHSRSKPTIEMSKKSVYSLRKWYSYSTNVVTEPKGKRTNSGIILSVYRLTRPGKNLYRSE